MKQNVQIMMDLLKAEICGAEPDAAAFLTLTEDEQDDLGVLAREHNVGHLLGDALERCENAERLPVTWTLFQDTMQAREETAKLSVEQDAVRDLLNQAGIRYIRLRGARIREYYPAMWMRPSYDLNLLIDQENVDTVLDLLTKQLKYRIGERHPRHIFLYSPSGLRFDLRFRLKGRNEAANHMLAKVWEYSTPVEGTCEYVQSNEFFLMHLISYMANRILGGGCGIRPVVDLYLLRQKFHRDEALLDELCRKAGLAKFHENLLVLMHAWFEGGSMTPQAEHLAQFILAGGQYGSRKNRIAISQQLSGHKRKNVPLMAPQPYEKLSAMYPTLKSNRWLLPVYQVWYWGKELSSGQLQEEYSNRAVSDSIDDSFSAKIGRLLKENGLL